MYNTIKLNKFNYFLNRSGIYNSSNYFNCLGYKNYSSNAFDKYLSNNKLNPKNINKVLDVLDNNDNDVSIINNIIFNINFDVSIFEHLNSVNTDKLNNYLPALSFNGIDSMDDIFNSIDIDDIYYEYKLKFIDLLNNLNENQIYKIVFRWESIDADNFAYRKSNFNTTPSFLFIRIWMLTYYDINLLVIII